MLNLLLRNNGVHSVPSIFNIRYILPYSTSTRTKKPYVMSEFLVNSLGFSKEEAITTSAKVIRVRSTENPYLVHDFLKDFGLNRTDIKNIVYAVPTVLQVDVENNLKPKFRVFQEIGLSGADLVKIISKNPTILRRGLDTHIKPTLDYLKSVLGSNENVAVAIRKSVWMLANNIRRSWLANTALLKRYGVSDERIQKVMLQLPRSFLVGPANLEKILVRVEEKLGIPRNSGMFMYGVDALASASDKVVESKFCLLKKFGLTETDIVTLFRKQPCCIKLSEDRITSALKFFMEEIGYEPGYIASRPVLLKFSLEKRVFPRYAVFKALKIKGLIQECSTNFYSATTLTESRFLERYVLKYQDVAPDLYEIYCNSMGSFSTKFTR